MTALATTSCNFDSGLCCDWQQSIADVFDWTINTGSTLSSNTGPDYDHTSGLGKAVTIIRLLPLILINFTFSEFRSPYDAIIKEHVFYSASARIFQVICDANNV